MRTCYCDGVTSDPTGPEAVARPGARSGAGPGTSAGPEDERRAGGWPGLSRCNVSHVWTIKNVTSVISRAPARQRRTHLGTRRNGVGRISVQNESAPAGIESDGGALVAPHYKPQLPKLTPRYRAS